MKIFATGPRRFGLGLLVLLTATLEYFLGFGPRSLAAHVGVALQAGIAVALFASAFRHPRES